MVTGVPGAVHKKFTNLREAQEYLVSGKDLPTYENSLKPSRIRTQYRTVDKYFESKCKAAPQAYEDFRQRLDKEKSPVSSRSSSSLSSRPTGYIPHDVPEAVRTASGGKRVNAKRPDAIIAYAFTLADDYKREYGVYFGKGDSRNCCHDYASLSEVTDKITSATPILEAIHLALLSVKRDISRQGGSQNMPKLRVVVGCPEIPDLVNKMYSLFPSNKWKDASGRDVEDGILLRIILCLTETVSLTVEYDSAYDILDIMATK